MEVKIEINDALASQIVLSCETVAVKALENCGEMNKNFSFQGFLNTLGGIVKPILEKDLASEKGKEFAKMIVHSFIPPQPQSKAPQPEPDESPAA